MRKKCISCTHAMKKPSKPLLIFFLIFHALFFFRKKVLHMVANTWKLNVEEEKKTTKERKKKLHNIK